MKIGVAFAVAAVLWFPGCSRWQMRADDLQQSIDSLVSGGHRQKDDFIRQFGSPTSCAPLTTGELCQWNTELGYVGSRFVAARVSDGLKVEFDKSGSFIKGSALVQRGGRTYQGESGAAESSRPDPTFGDCPQGQTFQNGTCTTLSPGHQ